MTSKPVVIKSTIGLLGIGGASFGAYEGYKALTKEEEKTTIADKIKESKYELLASVNDAWTTILASYKEIVKTKSDLKFDDFLGEDKAGSTPSKGIDILKQKCSEALTKENEDQLLKKAKKWCIVPISVTDLLGKQGFTPLKTNTGNPDEEKDKWEGRINAYREFKKTNQDTEELISGLQNGKITPENIVAIKTKCSEFGKIVSYHKDFETNIDKFKSWCTSNV